MSNLNEFVKGLNFVFVGFRQVLSNKSLWLWSAAPIIIDLILLFYLLTLAFSSLSVWVAGALGFIFSDPSGFLYSILYYPLYAILAIGFSVIIIFGIYLIGTVIASPFNSVIAEKVLVNRGLLPEKPFKISTWISTSLKMMLISLLRAFIFAMMGIVLFVCSFIPGLNIFSSFIAFVILAFDNMDYTYEAMEYSLANRFANLKSHPLLFSGMGTVIGVTLFIPGLTLVLMPFLVAGAASAYVPTKRIE